MTSICLVKHFDLRLKIFSVLFVKKSFYGIYEKCECNDGEWFFLSSAGISRSVGHSCSLLKNKHRLVIFGSFKLQN